MEDATLAQQLQPSAIAFDVLHANYRPMLGLVQELIGVVPNCDPLLEIWPTGFRTYNLSCVNHKDGCQLRDGKVPLMIRETVHGNKGQNASWLGAAL